MLKCEQYKHPLKHFPVPKVKGISARSVSLSYVYILDLIFREKQYISNTYHLLKAKMKLCFGK